MAVAKYTTLEDLKYWWDANTKDGNSRFILYHGQILRGNGNSGAKTLQQDDESMPVEESWNLLSEFVTRSKGGNYTILVKDLNRDYGNRAFYEQSTTSISGSSNYIGGVDSYIKTQLELAELKRRLDEKTPETSFWERVFPPEQLSEMITGLMPVIQSLAAAKIGLPTTQVNQQTDNQTQSDQNVASDLNRIAGLMSPEQIKTLANIAESNPDMIASLYKKTLE